MEKQYRVNITHDAYRQMETIRDYIAYELMSPKAAKNLLATFRKEILLLQWTPGMYSLVEKANFRKKGVRRFPVKNFLVYYWIDEDNKLVNVIAVIYARRDQLKQLENLDLE